MNSSDAAIFDPIVQPIVHITIPSGFPAGQREPLPPGDPISFEGEEITFNGEVITYRGRT